jgi:Na+/melibiose symporter-like transporter
MVSTYPGGSIQGYGVILILGVVMGLISLGFQYLMIDVNPQVEQITPSKPQQPQAIAIPSTDSDVVEPPVPLASPVSPPNLFKDANFLIFLAYFGVWMFAVNLSAPFFNLYLLDDLSLDVRWVTIYNSLSAGANLVALVIWGKIADRLGNRTILLTVGIVVAITPILWLGTGADSLSLWLWFPLLHMLGGSTWAAIDLCTNNMQLGVAPVQSRATCFAIAAAVAGVTGALGATAGGVLTQLGDYGGLPGMFALSTVVRLVALLPLVFVQEKRGRSLRQMMRVLFPDRSPSLSHQIQAGRPLDPSLDPSVEFIEASSLLDLEPPDLPLQD